MRGTVQTRCLELREEVWLKSYQLRSIECYLPIKVYRMLCKIKGQSWAWRQRPTTPHLGTKVEDFVLSRAVLCRTVLSKQVTKIKRSNEILKERIGKRLRVLLSVSWETLISLGSKKEVSRGGENAQHKTMRTTVRQCFLDKRVADLQRRERKAQRCLLRM